MSYDAVIAVSRDNPEWVPVIRACFAYPSEEFAGRWILQHLPGRPRTLKPLIAMGVLVRAQEASADGKTWYRFADREGAGRALAELNT